MPRTVISYAAIERSTAKIRRIDQRTELPIAIPVVTAAYVVMVVMVFGGAARISGVGLGFIGWLVLLLLCVASGVGASFWKRFELPFHVWAPMTAISRLRPRHTLGGVERIQAPVDARARLNVVVRPTHRWPDPLTGTLVVRSPSLVQGREGIEVDGGTVTLGRGGLDSVRVEPGVYRVEVAQ
jgi:hypothetical protein